MDWVETTGKSIDEATERALAHLGIHRSDAEVEVIEEPKAGLFGRVKGEARIRARVRPAGPRPKRSRRGGGRETSGRTDKPRGPKSSGDGARKPRESTAAPAEKKASPKPQRTAPQPSKEATMAESLSLAEQGRIAQEFLQGLLRTMNIQAEVEVKELDAETVELAIDATPPTELGILVGPRGATLQSLQEVTRTVVQSKSEARTDRILVDVAHYRERRVAALGRFATQVATEVVETGEERALEPMSPADRKAVHDALTGNSAVITRSEGDEPRRFVVISPA